MYFKRLELIGFKSFADKTVLNFEPGTTAIVGPNGCGKSNISDAIQWVLGEQSAKTLRGSKMEDLIFDGTQDRKPIGMTELSLTLGDADKSLNLDYNEITITRKLFRSGESAYLINKTPCRLKDISELFMGTGLGLSSYSVMEQGKMDLILKSKPDDRRYLFEEAAGITKYKTKKKEALRKLEYTESNLLRLSDIISEVKRQINSVKRQASKAKKYKNIDDDLRELETKITSFKYNSMKEEHQLMKNKSDSFDEQEKTLHQKIAACEKEINQNRINMDEILSNLSKLQEKRFELSRDIESIKTRSSYNKERVEELTENSSIKKKEISGLKSKAEELKDKKENILKELERATNERKSIDMEVKESSGELSNVNIRINTCISDIKQKKDKSVEALTINSQKNNEIIVLDQRERDIVLREKKFKVEEEEYHSKIESISSQLKIKTAELHQQQNHIRKIKKEIEDVQSDIFTRKERLDGIVREKINAQNLRSEKQSKLEVLLELKKKYEGFLEGAKDILKASRENSVLKGIIGPVSEVVKIDSGFELAVEASLESNSQVIITGSDTEGLDALQYLKKSNSGRASFMAVNAPKVITQYDVSLLQSEEGFAGHILDFISYEIRFKDIMLFLLGNVVVFSDFDKALSAAKKHNYPCDIVTKSGDMITDRCKISGGENKEVLKGIITREGQISRLEQEVGALDIKIGELSSSSGKMDTEMLGITKNSETLHADLYTNEVNLANLNSEVARLESQSAQIKSEKERLLSEIDVLLKEKHSIMDKRKKTKASFEESTKESKDLELLIKTTEEEREELTDQKNRIMERLTNLKIRQSELKSREDSIREGAGAINSMLEETDSTLEKAGIEIKASQERIAVLNSEISSAGVREKELKEKLSENETNESTLLSKKESVNLNILEAENILTAKRSELTALQDNSKNVEIKFTELKLNIDNLRERIWDEYKVALEEKEKESFDNVNWDEVEMRISELKRQRDSIGLVSLGAIEEFEELEERIKFLTEQQADLLKSKESLHTAIRTINTTTRKVFIETFEKIRNNFKEMFEILFGGGKADLRFVGEGDVLEAGVDIIATPPGKKLRLIDQLSGGEKALTAIALLFALFKVRPSPFCVLDEIDAPLDETNITRFVNLLKDFTEKTQFIIITHNKRTIGISDVMYGITMEEKGVSKVVSVKFAGKEPELVAG